MIIFLAIIITIIIIWSFISLMVCFDADDMEIDLEYDGWFTTISKMYWYIILIFVSLILIFGFSYFLSKKIICNVTNNDNYKCVDYKEGK